jgi:predicted RNA-binding Zn ribbon-like protein
MSSTIAPGEHSRPALALVNSRRSGPQGAVDELETPAALRAWLASHGLPALAAREALGAMCGLRDAVRELLLARIEERAPDPAAVEVVNAAAAAAPTAPRLVWAAPHAPRLERDFPDAAGPALARAVFATDAIDLVTGPDHADLRACAAPGCIRLLLKDHPRRQWCSKRCGDRVRASRYYHRHHGRTAP